MTSAAPLLDVVIPVYNEQAGVARSVRRLHRYLADEFPFSWRIVVADNASTDATPEIGRALAAELAGVRYERLEHKGRGRALRAAWAASDARVVCYMDVDLSTDLRALLPLVAPLVSGHSNLVLTGGDGPGLGGDTRTGSTTAMATVQKSCKAVSSVSGLYDCRGASL